MKNMQLSMFMCHCTT